MNKSFIRELNFYEQSAQTGAEITESVKNFIEKLLQEYYQKEEYILNIIFVNGEDIQDLNKQYLEHDYPTDVLTFDFSEDFGVFGGDIFICPEIVYMNATDYNVLPEEELLRVICHGILHLLGYDDKTEHDRVQMLEQEEYCLELYRSR